MCLLCWLKGQETQSVNTIEVKINGDWGLLWCFGLEGCSFTFQSFFFSPQLPLWWGATYDTCSTAGSDAAIGQVGTVTYFIEMRWCCFRQDGSVLPRQYAIMWLKNLCPGCLKDLYTLCSAALLYLNVVGNFRKRVIEDTCSSVIKLIRSVGLT